jgi:hypothetical protein
MRPHVVRQGEYVTQLAARLGFDADEVWHHSANAELRERRPQRDVLAPGDVLRVPDQPGNRRPSFASGGTRRYRARVPVVTVRLVLDDGRGPIGDEPYEVHGLPGREPVRGTTGSDGVVRVDVPVHVSRVDLVLVRLAQTFPLLVGHLDPPDESTGLRSRLRGLGHLLPSPSEVLPHPLLLEHGTGEGEPERIRRALEAFRRGEGHEPSEAHGTSDADDARVTRDALVARHGS